MTETKSKHTPGPWHVEKSGHIKHPCYIYSENGKALASTIYPDMELDEQTANASIIAVTPEFFDALKQWAWAEKNEDPMELDNARRSRDVAIAKVEREKS